MNPIYEKKQREYEAKKARAKALALRLTCTICGAKPKTLLNCPCGTTQCAPAPSRRSRTVGGAARSRRDTDPQVLFDGLSTHRLARPRTSEGLQEDPGRAGGGGGPGGSADAPAVAPAGGVLRPRAAIARRRGPRAHRRRTRGCSRAARGGAGAEADSGAAGVAMPALFRGLGRERHCSVASLLLRAYLCNLCQKAFHRRAVSSLSHTCSKSRGRACDDSSPRGE